MLLLSACDSVSAPEHFSSAQDYFDQGDHQTAVIELKNALQKDPELGDARLLLALAYEIQGQYADALREFERAQNLRITDARLEPGLLNAKLRLGRFQEVIGELGERETLSAELTLILADAYLAAEDLDSAELLYGEIDGSAGSARGMGTIAWIEGDLDRARALFADAVRLDPEDRESWVRQGELALSEQRFDVAADAFGKGKSLPGGAASGGLGLARTFLAQGRLDEALIETEAVLAEVPGLYLAHYVEALIRYGQDDVDGAEAAIRQVQRVMPDHTPSLYLMGAIKFRQGQLNQAEGSLLRYLSRDRSNESAAKLLAVVRAQKDDLTGTIETLTPYAQTSQDPQLLAMLGTAQLRQGDASEATATLERAVALAPDAAAFRNQLALSLLSSGEEERAVTELESAISVDGTQFQSDYLMAMLSLKKREFGEALGAAERMIAKSPDLPMGFNLKGAALLGQGDEAGARAAFAEASRIAPEFLPSAQNLARLDEADGDLAAARARYEVVIEASENNVAARLALADLAASEGMNTLAREQLEAVVLAAPDSLPARMGLARLALRDDSVIEARRHAEDALRLAPEQADVLLLNGQLALRAADRESARSLGLRLTRTLRDSSLDPTFALLAGRMLRGAGLNDAARDTLAQVVVAPSDPEIAIALLVEKVQLEIGARSAQAARLSLEQLRAVTPEADSLRFYEAEVLLLEGREAEAMSGYAALAAGGDRRSVLRLAALQQQAGQVDSALSLLDDWLQTNPEDDDAKLLRANALLRFDRDRAIAQYEAMVDSDNAVALNNLAWLYMEAGDERAVATAERALALAPDNADIADTLGWILVQNGQAERAIDLIRRSSEQNPEDATVRYHLGVAYLDAGRMAAGRAALEEAIRLGPFPELEDAERRLTALGAEDQV
jgi:putative PEP-CTERM system TPR-repeat lipoprotein